MFSYRDAKPDDFIEIAAFASNRKEAFYMFPRGVYPMDASQLFELSQPRKLPTVIEQNARVIGYGNFYDVAENEYGWLGNVIVNSAYRGSGAGKFLINVMSERARNELMIRELHLICHNTNTKAIFLYSKLGFNPYGIKEMLDYENNPLAGIQMKKALKVE